MIWTEMDEFDNQIIHKRYEGTYSKGKRHGKGVLVMGPQEVYSGMFENDLFHGTGLLKKKNGDVIEGEFYQGKSAGKNNVVTFKNGDKYVGEMKGGEFHGEGEFTYRNNQGMYKGSWSRGRQHGRGIRVFVNNNRFTGTFLNGSISGDGIMMYANGINLLVVLINFVLKLCMLSIAC